jgi:NAD(P)-dependent dehydrogenase (short-subunit alcohol dehydrogenase family)
MDLMLTNRVALITGGASGIGRATANAFAAEGAHVALWDLNDKTEAVAEDIRSRFSVKTTGIAVDVTNEADVNAALKRTSEVLGPIDHVVHAAAIGSGKFGFPFTQLEPSDWPRVMTVNVMGMVHIAHALAPHLIERSRGTFVFIASVAGQIGSQTDPPYSASKAANINFAQCLAKDLAPHNIRVNTVCPGMVQTALNRLTWQSWQNQNPQENSLTYEEWGRRKIGSLVPLGKWQTPEAIADMIVFLSSDRSSHVTGQTINVDGGFVMHW